MNSDIENLAKLAQSYRENRLRLEELRRREIRESDIKNQAESFAGLFEMSVNQGISRRPQPLSNAMRVFLGIKR